MDEEAGKGWWDVELLEAFRAMIREQQMEAGGEAIRKAVN